MFQTFDVVGPVIELSIVFVTIAFLCAFKDAIERPLFIMQVLNILMVGDASIVGITLWQFIDTHPNDNHEWIYHHPGLWAGMIMADFTRQIGVWYFIYQYLRVAYLFQYLLTEKS